MNTKICSESEYCRFSDSDLFFMNPHPSLRDERVPAVRVQLIVYDIPAHVGGGVRPRVHLHRVSSEVLAAVKICVHLNKQPYIKQINDINNYFKSPWNRKGVSPTSRRYTLPIPKRHIQ